MGLYGSLYVPMCPYVSLCPPTCQSLSPRSHWLSRFPWQRCSLPRCTLRPSLHAHHPRHCAFHLRDWDIARLQRLLQVGGVSYDTEPPPGVTPPPGGGCWLEELKEPPGAPPHDAPCGRPTDVGQAGLCRSHYSEYLISMIWSVGVDPLRLYGCSELLLAAQRHLPAGRPPKEQHESEAQYTQRLRQLLQSEAPVRPRPRKRSPAHPICVFNQRTRDGSGAV
ncbi:E3 ubiquitin-protein ligase RNF31 [Coturnix japonica]|uniref:E3 ubiquitin-protein ligase RNF31 n=1 Tax=Coturnix japonica TaxID=93934 RepID=UPI00077775DB|nr:E3 ubiquitin-protein ligase RNF31 [Coturnix japonica]